MKVFKRSLVSFSIGKTYKDKVWCDVVPMDAHHLLLGRPWQYDRKIVHDGYKNTHSFIKDGVRVTLAPMNSEGNMKPTNSEGQVFFTGSQVENVILKVEDVFVLLVKEESETEGEPPELIKPIFKEYEDLILEECQVVHERNTTPDISYSGVITSQ